MIPLPKVLIVDDQITTLSLSRKILECQNIDIFCAQSGQEALDLAHKHEFAVALMDVQMPGMNGYQTATALRKIENNQPLSIIFMSATYTDSSHIFKGYEIGAVDYLVKPLDGHLLNGKVKIFCDLYQQKKMLQKAYSELEVRVLQRTRELDESNRALARENAIRKESEETARVLLRAPADIVLLTDSSGKIIDANQAAADSFQMATHQLRQEVLWNLLPPQLAQRKQELYEQVIQSGKPLQTEQEFQGTWWELTICPVFDENRLVTRIACWERDITQRKQAERKLGTYQKRLKSLASDLLLTEEKERRRLAIDLHDSIGQSLAISRIKLDFLNQELKPGPLKDTIQDVTGLIKQTIQHTRTLTFQLSPPILYELGLEPALESLVEQMELLHGIKIGLFCDSRIEIPNEDMRILLFRTVQELMINVVKHAKTKEVSISLRRLTGQIKITVLDRGVGFDLNAKILSSDVTVGFGLFSIQERIQNAGGNFHIESTLGMGTEAVLTIPI